MGLFSFFTKNKQEATTEDSGLYIPAEEMTPTARARSKRASNAGGATPRRAGRDTPDPVLPEKKRARRRLVGAIALALAVAVGLPMVLDSEPKPLASDIAIQIPSKDKPAAADPAPPLASAIAAAPDSGATTAPASGAVSRPGSSKVAASEALDQAEEIIDEPVKPARPVAAVKPKPLPAEPTTAPVVARLAEPKLDTEAKPEPRIEHKPEPKVLAKLDARHEADVKAAELKAAETKAAEARQAEAKRVEARQVELKQAEAKRFDARQAELKQAELKQAEAKHAEAKHDSKPEPKVADVKPVSKPAPKADSVSEAPKPAAGGEAARALSILEGKPAAKPAAEANTRYVVQLGAFATQDKVDELQAKLREAGVASFTQKIPTPSGERTRVRIGPFGNKEEAEKARARLSRIGLSGSLVPT